MVGSAIEHQKRAPTSILSPMMQWFVVVVARESVVMQVVVGCEPMTAEEGRRLGGGRNAHALPAQDGKRSDVEAPRASLWEESTDLPWSISWKPFGCRRQGAIRRHSSTLPEDDALSTSHLDGSGFAALKESGYRSICDILTTCVCGRCIPILSPRDVTCEATGIEMGG